jgi:ArsR family transcriptional regulator
MKNKHHYNEKAKILKALAHPTRLFIVDFLADGEQCVCKFVDQIEADFSTISKHLSVLKQAGLVEDEKRGKMVYYRLRFPCVKSFMSCVEKTILNNLDCKINLMKKVNSDA